MTSVAIVYHSGYGHTKRQAEAVRPHNLFLSIKLFLIRWRIFR
jgi:hypothetical protein